MRTHVTTTGAIHAHQAFRDQVVESVDETMSRFGDIVTRVDIHLVEESARRSSAESVRCTAEAHVAGHGTVVVTQHAEHVEPAVREAVEKLEGSIARALGRLGVR
jgi:ribosome-associated translation inhibitor RaiA